MSDGARDHEVARFSRREILSGAMMLAGAVLLDSCGGPARRLIAPSPESGTAPSWEQDFTKMADGQPSPRYWNFDTGTTIPSYNNEAEVYTEEPKNVRIENGALILEAHKEGQDGRHYTSGRINTQGKFSFTYGKLEVALRSPAGIGTWPAAWLLPDSSRYAPGDYGLADNGNNDWLLNGEIDFFETVGSLPDKLYPDIHTYALRDTNGTFFKPVPTMSTGFNTYGVEKTPERIAFTLNGQVYHAIEKTSDDPRSWPFDQPYFLILNLAMGGTWGGTERDQYPPDGIKGDGPWNMAVKHVRFYDVAQSPAPHTS